MLNIVNVVINFSVIVIWVCGYCFAIATQNSEIYCGACIALVDEMNWKINSVDKKSTLQVGSFRIDPSGNQQLREIPLARSELHLTELLEQVCADMSDYGQSVTSDGKRNFIRTSTRDGSVVMLDSVQRSATVNSRLKSACETLIEEHEELLIEAFKQTEDDVENHLCVTVLELCKSNNVTDHRQATDDAVSAAVSQRAADEDVTERTDSAADEQQPTDDQTPALDSVDDLSASVELSKEDL